MSISSDAVELARMNMALFVPMKEGVIGKKRDAEKIAKLLQVCHRILGEEEWKVRFLAARRELMVG